MKCKEIVTRTNYKKVLGKRQMYLYAQTSLKQFVASRIVCTKREKVYSKSNWDDAIVSIYRNNELFEFFISINT